MARHRFKFGSIVIEAYPWKHPASGRDYWRAEYHSKDGSRHFMTRSTLEKMRKAAGDKAAELQKDTVDFAALAPETLRRIRRLLDADPSLAFADEYLELRQSTRKTKKLETAVDDFLKLKDANKGRSIQNVRTLRTHLVRLKDHFPDRGAASITVKDLEAFMETFKATTNRTRRNIRASLVTLWNWMAKHEDVNEPTAASKLDLPIITRKVPTTWDPEHLAVMLANVRPQYRGWIAAAAFGGFRTDEIRPIPGGEKSPLDWSDFKWDRGIVIVRPETAKTGHRRVVPILPALRAWLHPIKKDSGPICDASPPHKDRAGNQSETKRLGALVGGWRPNALRHSWISFRASEVGLASGLCQ